MPQQAVTATIFFFTFRSLGDLVLRRNSSIVTVPSLSLQSVGRNQSGEKYGATGWLPTVFRSSASVITRSATGAPIQTLKQLVDGVAGGVQAWDVNLF